MENLEKKENIQRLTLSEAINKGRQYKSATWFDNVIDSKNRAIISSLLIFFSLISLILFILKYFNIPNLSRIIKDKIPLTANLYFGLFLLLLISFIILKIFRAYLFSIMFTTKGVSFDLLKIFFIGNYKNDDVSQFLKSPFGREVTNRLFLEDDKVNQFIKDKEDYLLPDDYIFEKNDVEKGRIEEGLNTVDYVQAIYEQDKGFSNFLSRNEITKSDIIEVSIWVLKKHYNYKNKKRWWSKERLSTAGKIGSSLSYGQTHFLEKFASSIENSKKSIFGNSAYENYENDIKKIERVLIRNEKNNAFFISPSSILSIELLKAFNQKIKRGRSYKKLERSRIFILPSLMMLESAQDNFEKIFLRLLNEANDVGNIILVFDDFHSFYEKAKGLNIDVLSIMKSYFNSNISFIILSSKNDYESFFQTNIYLKEYFETINTYQNTTEGLLFLLQNKIFKIEKINNIFFSYRALKYLLESVEKYYANFSIVDKFLGVINEFLVYEKRRGNNDADRVDAKKYIQSKTGITQIIDAGSRKKLLTMEDELHKRVIGQNRAIIAISNVIRRLNSGLTDKNKPIASFIFIGSTGVGKTETAKALAETYFGDEKKIIRFDMSEYSTSEGVAGLIGSTYTNKKGSLSKVVNINQNSLILFDEIEKASRDVHDLFLQILDEGSITDAFGQKLNFKNNIIIATSNAGSDLIYSGALNEISADDQKDKIVNYIIKNKIFRPEFMNRFDEIILFQKLTHEEIKKIAGLQLKSLVKKLKHESYELLVTESLKEFLANNSHIATFGAREIKRVIKNEIESMISKKIIEETIKKGDKFIIKINDNELGIEIIK